MKENKTKTVMFRLEENVYNELEKLTRKMFGKSLDELSHEEGSKLLNQLSTLKKAKTK